MTVIHAIRVNHHSEYKAQLLKEMLPAFREIAALDEVVTVWPQRHWLFGPHVLVLISSEKPLSRAVTERARSLVHDALLRAPSPAPIDSARWVDISVSLGRLELVPGPYSPIRADNTVEESASRITDSFLRDEASVIERGRMIAYGLERITHPVGSISDSFATPLAGMAVLASSYYEGGLAKGYLAFLSHWKEFFHWNDPRGGVEKALAASYAVQSTDILEIVGAARDAVAGRRSSDSHRLGAWLDWVRAGEPGAIDLAERKLVLPYPHASRRAVAASMASELEVRWGGGDDRSYSDFHRQFRRLDFAKLGDGIHFSAYRFQINTLFELLSLLDVAPSERYALAYFLTRATEELVGTSWNDSVQASISSQHQDPTASPTLPWRGAQ
jgi:hypothetical protein